MGAFYHKSSKAGYDCDHGRHSKTLGSIILGDTGILSSGGVSGVVLVDPELECSLLEHLLVAASLKRIFIIRLAIDA